VNVPKLLSQVETIKISLFLCLIQAVFTTEILEMIENNKGKISLSLTERRISFRDYPIYNIFAGFGFSPCDVSI